MFYQLMLKYIYHNLKINARVLEQTTKTKITPARIQDRTSQNKFQIPGQTKATLTPKTKGSLIQYRFMYVYIQLSIHSLKRFINNAKKTN